MQTSPRYDTLLTELKAAAVDVAARGALEAGAEVVFCDNRAVLVEEDSLPVDERLAEVVELATRRAEAR